MGLVVIKAELEQGKGGGAAINDGANGSAVEGWGAGWHSISVISLYYPPGIGLRSKGESEVRERGRENKVLKRSQLITKHLHECLKST